MNDAVDDVVTAGRGEPSSSFAGGHAAGDELAARLGELARAFEQEHDTQRTLDAIVHAAVGTVPGAQHASLSAVLRRRQVVTRASTGELPLKVDQVQYESGQGPCLDSLYEQRTVRLSDMASEQRWPQFTDRVGGLGVRSMLAVQLYVAGEDLGALNLFAEDAGAFTDESEQIALLFASHAAVAMAGAEQQGQLQHALNRRDLIGQAKGILIERHRITGDQAFRTLVVASQATNRKLHDIAEELVKSGELPRR